MPIRKYRVGGKIGDGAEISENTILISEFEIFAKEYHAFCRSRY